MAMTDAGLLQEGDDPTPEQYANNLNRLNDLINFWQTQGLKVWLQYDLPVPLTQGQGTYTLGPGGSVDMVKPTRVIDGGYYIDNNDVKRPLTMLSRDEYTRLSQVTQQGAVNSYFVDKQVTQLIVHLWLVPDAFTATNGQVHLTIQQQATQLVSLTDSLNFPQEWFLALRWGLADDICTGQPQAIMTRCMAKANMYREALEAWDVEDASTVFQPDQRAINYRGAFR
jgi:hypothetical protein